MTANQGTEKTETTQPTTIKHTNQAQPATALSGLYDQIRRQPVWDKAKAAQLGQFNLAKDVLADFSSAVAGIQGSCDRFASTIAHAPGIEALRSTLYPVDFLDQRKLQKIKSTCLGEGLGSVNAVPKWLSSAVIKPSKLDKFSDLVAHASGISKQFQDQIASIVESSKLDKFSDSIAHMSGIPKLKRFQDQMASVFDIPKLDVFKTSMAGVIGGLDLKRPYTTMGEQINALGKQWKEVYSSSIKISIPDTIWNSGLDSTMASGIAKAMSSLDFLSHSRELLRTEMLEWKRLSRQIRESVKGFASFPSMEDVSRKARERGEINEALFNAVMMGAGLAVEGGAAAWYLIGLLWPRVRGMINGFAGLERSLWDSSDYEQEAYEKILNIVRWFSEGISYVSLVKVVTEDAPEDIANYLLKSVKNRLIDVRKAACAQKRLVPAENIRFDSDDPREITVLDAVMIEDIPILNRISDEEQIDIFADYYPLHYQAVMLVKHDGYTQRETAEIMDISQPRVCILLSEAAKKAKKISEGLYSGDRNSLYIVEGDEL